ncbi:MAG: hypothetical protein NTY53_18790 [Kiritimatiellaeota bacterium]|nr:hypothetical protein [Kiritimatiellota bacterium]
MSNEKPKPESPSKNYVDEWDNPPPSIAPAYVRIAAVKPEALEDGLPMRWFFFYTYIRIPIGLLLTSFYVFLGWFGMSLARVKIDHSILVVLIVLELLMFGLLLALLIGLHKRKRWGWNLNWAVLVMEVLARALKYISSPGKFIAVLAVFTLIWFLPNAIYFWKRRFLFH